MAKLSQLPDEIVGEIVKRVSGVEDAVRFPAVCKSVRTTHEEKRSKPFGPWLMLANLENDDKGGGMGIRECYSLTSNQLFSLSLPELQGRRGWGTPHGWLLTVGLDLQISLFHPFTRAKISLPPQPKFKNIWCDYDDGHHVCSNFIERVALSSNPSSTQPQPVVIMVTYGGGRQISFASPGDKSWTYIKTPTCFDDVIFYMGSFFCLDGDGDLYVCNVDPLRPSARCISSCRIKGLRRVESNYYLVEISGRLYFIQRNAVIPPEEPGLHPRDLSTLRCEASDFNAYEFNFRDGTWMDNVEDFNGHAVLLGNNTSCAISTVDCPELSPDCIYFTDDDCDKYDSKRGCYNDMGVYDFKKKTMMEPFYKINKLASKFSRPFFFIPTLK